MGFQSKNVKWTEVPEAGTSSMIPAGGYIAIIQDVEDVESKEYMRFTYDIAEGEHAGFFKDEDRVYTHQFTRSYKDKAMPFMAQFLNCVDASNTQFDLAKWDNDPAKLIGLNVGVIIQREDYTNTKGEDRARMNVEAFASADDIRSGRFKMPDPKDTRDSKPVQTSTENVPQYDDSNIPF